MNKRIKTIALFLAVITCLTVFPAMHTNDAAADSNGGAVMVSMGDSYSSGEGIPPFYGERYSDDWLAHRSQNSWPGMLVLPNGENNKPMSDASNRNRNWFFVAASGATTDDFFNEQTITVNRHIWPESDPDLPPQCEVLDRLASEGRDVDYITMTIGGNDAHFSTVIETITVVESVISPNGYYDLVNDVFDANLNLRFENKLRDTYRKVAKKAPNATIIVAGYPELIDETSTVARGLFVQPRISDVNTLVRMFNLNLSTIIADMRKNEGMNIYFVSVADEFRAHKAYSDDAYLEPVKFGPRSEDTNLITIASQYSMHPNSKGAKVYASAVQKLINQLENWKALYQNFISDGSYRTYLKNDISADGQWFALHDMDGDNIPELIFNGGGEWDAYACHVCTVRDGKVKYLGSMTAPLGIADEYGGQFGYRYYDNTTYQGLFFETEIYGYYQNRSDYYCGYHFINSSGKIEGCLVEARSGDEIISKSGVDAFWEVPRTKTARQLRFFRLETLQNGGWDSFWQYWQEPGTEAAQPVEETNHPDLWNTIDRSGVLNDLGATYDTIRSKAGALQYVAVEYDAWRHYTYSFANLSDVAYSFETDLSQAEEKTDWYGKIAANVASQYVKGDDRCDGLVIARLSTLGFTGSMTANAIGAELFEFMPDAGLWVAHAERKGCDYYFFCDDSSGTISANSSCWIVTELPERTQATQKDGWVNVGRSQEAYTEGEWYYYVSGKPVTGWRKIDGETYYFYSDGRMAGGFASIDGTQYFFREHFYGAGPSSGNEPYHGMLSHGGFEQRSIGDMVFCNGDGSVVTYDGEGSGTYFPYATAAFDLIWDYDRLSYESDVADYGYVDIDRDGHKEFWIKRGTGEANAVFVFYTPDFSSGQYVQIGTVSGANSRLEWDGQRLYLVSGSTKRQIRIVNGAIAVESSGDSQPAVEQPKSASKQSLAEKLLSDSHVKEIGMTFEELNNKYGPLDYVYLTPEDPIQAVFKNSSVVYYFQSVEDNIPDALWDESVANNGVISPASAKSLIYDSDCCTGIYARFPTLGVSNLNSYETWFTSDHLYYDELLDAYFYTTTSGRYDLSVRAYAISTNNFFTVEENEWVEIALHREYWKGRTTQAQTQMQTVTETQSTSKWHYDPYAARSQAEHVLNTIDGKGATYVSRLLREGGLTSVKQSGAGDLIDYLNNPKKWDGETIGKVVLDPSYSDLEVGDVLCTVCAKGSSAADYSNGHSKGKGLYYGIQVYFVSEVGPDYVCVYSKNNDRHNDTVRLSCNGGSFHDKCGKCANGNNVHWIAFCFDDRIK